ncbi:hypothetical protein M758_10G046700 [Ceratodon purpureus]|nr:hypothetical protein M758_10G046700 [Ceratodon purpureus]
MHHLITHFSCPVGHLLFASLCLLLSPLYLRHLRKQSPVYREKLVHFIPMATMKPFMLAAAALALFAIALTFSSPPVEGRELLQIKPEAEKTELTEAEKTVQPDAEKTEAEAAKTWGKSPPWHKAPHHGHHGHHDGEKPPHQDGKKPHHHDGKKPPHHDDKKPPHHDDKKPPHHDGKKPTPHHNGKPHHHDGKPHYHGNDKKKPYPSPPY